MDSERYVYAEIMKERERQIAKGITPAADDTNPFAHIHGVATGYLAFAGSLALFNSHEKCRTRLIKTIAILVALVAWIDRKALANENICPVGSVPPPAEN